MAYARWPFSRQFYPTSHLPRTNKPSLLALLEPPFTWVFYCLRYPREVGVSDWFPSCYECCNPAKQILASPALCVVFTFYFFVSDTASIVRFVAETCSSSSASQHLGQIRSFTGRCGWGNHGLLRRAKGHLFVTSPVWLPDVATCSNTFSKHSGSLSTTGSFGAHVIYLNQLHTGLHVGASHHLLRSSRALPCAGTAREDAGHWRFPVRWLIAANSCRHNDVLGWRAS